MSLTKKQEKFLRTIAHGKKPVIWLGQQGLTDNIVAEVENALDHHELVKLKLRVGDRKTRDSIIEDLCAVSGTELVQKIGNIVTLYRGNRKSPVIKLPK